MTSDEGPIEAIGIGRRDRKTGAWLIRDVNVAIGPGNRLGVLGPSGAGKTVLLRAFARLDPLDEVPSVGAGSRSSARTCPRTADGSSISTSGRPCWRGPFDDNLRSPFSLRAHRDRSFDRERVETLLARLGRDCGFLDKAGRDLSGGESQLVGLVRALQLDPSVLLLDEPTASLDPPTAAPPRTC